MRILIIAITLILPHLLTSLLLLLILTIFFYIKKSRIYNNLISKNVAIRVLNLCNCVCRNIIQQSITISENESDAR